MTLARPTTESRDTVAPGSVSWCERESAELARWSPITHSRPWGTVMSNCWVDGAFPGYR